MLNVLDLFSGIGGFSVGLEQAGGFRTVAFAESDPFCRQVLAKHWPNVPIFHDVRSIGNGLVDADIICGGFPCQDVSISGRGAGLAGKQSRLWQEFFRVICDFRLRFAIVENVAEICTRGMGELVGQLSDVGYDAEWEGIPAAAVGAVHLRARQWILAYPASYGDRLQARTIFPRRLVAQCRAWWSAEPGVPRVDDGIRSGVDRRRTLGNAVVPQIVEIIGRAILEAEAG